MLRVHFLPTDHGQNRSPSQAVSHKRTPPVPLQTNTLGNYQAPKRHPKVRSIVPSLLFIILTLIFYRIPQVKPISRVWKTFLLAFVSTTLARQVQHTSSTHQVHERTIKAPRQSYNRRDPAARIMTIFDLQTHPQALVSTHLPPPVRTA